MRNCRVGHGRPNPDGRDEDKYGRKLRIVTRGGESLGGVLVDEGSGRAGTRAGGGRGVEGARNGGASRKSVGWTWQSG